MDERRAAPRRHLYYYSRVFDENTQQMAGRLVDLTTKGMMIVSEKPVDSETTFKFKLFLPKSIEGKKTLIVEARSRWSKQAVNPDLYDNGFQLLNVTPDSAQTIRSLIQTSSFNY
ncbi:MAG: PilZ domain-containing protein [candidate division Zixibacteria bacterium]|nr:PilZ domain-containing protein [candidate division Zixibacteria bacterium]